jgi:hypothetical protein
VLRDKIEKKNNEEKDTKTTQINLD